MAAGEWWFKKMDADVTMYTMLKGRSKYGGGGWEAGLELQEEGEKEGSWTDDTNGAEKQRDERLMPVDVTAEKRVDEKTGRPEDER